MVTESQFRFPSHTYIKVPSSSVKKRIHFEPLSSSHWSVHIFAPVQNGVRVRRRWRKRPAGDFFSLAASPLGPIGVIVYYHSQIASFNFFVFLRSSARPTSTGASSLRSVIAPATINGGEEIENFIAYKRSTSHSIGPYSLPPSGTSSSVWVVVTSSGLTGICNTPYRDHKLQGRVMGNTVVAEVHALFCK